MKPFGQGVALLVARLHAHSKNNKYFANIIVWFSYNQSYLTLSEL